MQLLLASPYFAVKFLGIKDCFAMTDLTCLFCQFMLNV